jgi:preprotein translocase subunit SecD
MMRLRGLLLALPLFLLASCQSPPAAFRGPAYNDILLSCGEERSVLPGAYILSVRSEADKLIRGRWLVRIKLTAEGSRQFADITGRNIGKKLSLGVGGLTILTATIMEPIPGGEISISSYSRAEADRLVDMFRKD